MSIALFLYFQHFRSSDYLIRSLQPTSWRKLCLPHCHLEILLLFGSECFLDLLAFGAYLREELAGRF